MTPRERSLTPSSRSSSLRTYSVAFLVSLLVAEVRLTLAPNRWLMVEDLPTPEERERDEMCGESEPQHPAPLTSLPQEDHHGVVGAPVDGVRVVGVGEDLGASDLLAAAHALTEERDGALVIRNIKTVAASA